jgi:hypothetical protein
MPSSGRRWKQPWWSRWPVQVYRLAPSISRVVLGVAIFLACSMIFVVVANPLSVPRMALGTFAVGLVVGSFVLVASRVRDHRP